ncbi:hypothetical protein B188_25580 [Candidatus Brocadiaceae bacterium B188]|nr:DUF2141 domain-containing protein [Candidatus Brocadia sapporoensis]QQR65800.1 MAG: DUF2141 domain-containing protein [Candidatus Brocadia sp.]RZV59699.1 MAG: DUF2141 domain-containing protein [Candidatus Brocadia sp. BROELEC01]TWU50128.1 hypothetical protein B188_25580 [Candidatus Brocadiaceae bacterium B188]
MAIFSLKDKEGWKNGSKILLLAGLLWSVFSFRLYANDIIVTVDRFTDIENKAPVRFSICNGNECHKKKDEGYAEIEAHLIEQKEYFRRYKIQNIAPGEHSLSAYHDLNNNGKLDRSAVLGIPKEPIGFSALDIPKMQRYPKWDEIKFEVRKQETSVNVHLIHRFGL